MISPLFTLKLISFKAQKRVELFAFFGLNMEDMLCLKVESLMAPSV
jgi:hypothetical protein